MAESEEELKSLLMKVRESEKVAVKLNIQKTKIMASGPITSWHPLDCKEIQPFNPKGNQSWIFIGRTDAETAILWPSDAKNWLIGIDPDAGQDWRQEEKGTPDYEMVEWHHRLNGYKFEQALGVGDGQGGLALLQSMESRSVGQDWATELKPLCPWDFPGKNNGAGCHLRL